MYKYPHMISMIMWGYLCEDTYAMVTVYYFTTKIDDFEKFVKKWNKKEIFVSKMSYTPMINEKQMIRQR